MISNATRVFQVWRDINKTQFKESHVKLESSLTMYHPQKLGHLYGVVTRARALLIGKHIGPHGLLLLEYCRLVVAL